eukprot:TRINITY_DN295_c1_g1_i1.p1 TRINITY_DN295_c1_g1~~TRINITY_DN295_c1_g1_i1.p1  ORF type:complete len:427 (+),score=126.79 TRINITY_DN295_c1_g1_i1:46-1326(+)
MLSFVSVLCATAFLPYQNPRWPATYNMSMSSITMACNGSGWYDPSLGGAFGITSYDWSNAKKQWANAKPMDCEERLVTQATMTKKVNPNTNVFVYRNLVKALPWFTSVREKLDDPAYSGFFLKFKSGGAFPNGSYHVPQCTSGKCSPFYHDQEQTPEHPTPNDPHPDGSCTDECDCGMNPCGEYLWDHRNGTMLRDFLVNTHIMGANGVGNPNVDGLFIDDYWCSNLVNSSCRDPVQGPSEINQYSQVDMGLSDQDIKEITEGWLETMTAAQNAMLAAKGFTWSLIPGQANANASPVKISNSSCSSMMRGVIQDQKWQELPLIFGLDMGTSPNLLPQLTQDIAAFLLMRGPYAYVGAGIWGMSWPAGVQWDKKQPEQKRPKAMDTDYGSPLGLATEPKTNTFVREYTKSTVTLDCNNFFATIVMKQ